MGERPDRNKLDIIAVRYIEDHGEYERKKSPDGNRSEVMQQERKLHAYPSWSRGLTNFELKVCKIIWENRPGFQCLLLTCEDGLGEEL